MAIVLSAVDEFIGPSTYFRYTEPEITSYETSTISVPFVTSTLNFGQYALCRIPKKDDVVKSIYMQTILGPLYTGNETGYVYPTPAASIPNIAVYDNTGHIVVDPVNTIGFYNTQLLNIWLYTAPGVTVTLSSTNQFVFTGLTSLTFHNEQAASFWGFDINEADVYDHTTGYFTFKSLEGTLNLIQSGWVPGFQPPPPGFNYYPSVGDLVVQSATLFIGNQTIQTLTSNIMMIEDDILVPLENQAGLTITVGKNDTSTVYAPRTYWTKLDFDPVPIGQLGHQIIQVGVQFAEFSNLTSVSTTGGPTSNSYTQVAQVNNSPDFTIPYLDYIISTYQGAIILTNVISYQTYSAGVTNQDTLPCVNNGNLYFMEYTGSENRLSVFSNILSQQFGYLTFGPDISSFGAAPYNVGTVTITTDVFLVYSNVFAYYDTAYDITDINGYHVQTYPPTNVLPLDNTGLFTQTAIAIGKYIYVSVQYANADNSILGVDTTRIINGTESSTMYKQSSRGNTFFGIPVTDGSHLYYDSNGGLFAQVNLDLTFTTYSPPLPSHDYVVLLYDGIYIYYSDRNASTVFYNTTMSFTSPNAWTHVTRGFVNGCLTSTYVYLYDPYGGLWQLNQYKVTPSLQSQLVVEYSKLENPVAHSENIISETLNNTLIVPANTTIAEFILDFRGPIRELWFQTPAIIQRTVLQLNGETYFDEDYSSLTNLRPYEYHVITSSMNIMSYSIALDPNTVEPTGTLNISRIADPILTVYLGQSYPTPQTIQVYARSMNILTCAQGIGGLKYN